MKDMVIGEGQPKVSVNIPFIITRDTSSRNSCDKRATQRLQNCI